MRAAGANGAAIRHGRWKKAEQLAAPFSPDEPGSGGSGAAPCRYFVVVLDSGVELVGGLLMLPELLEPVLDSPLDEPVPELPIELVPGAPLVPDDSLLEPLPAMLPPLGLVLLLDEVEPVPALPPPGDGPLLQALRDTAATTVSVASATCVREVFIRKLLEVDRDWRGFRMPYRAL
jgi:hypothetical protein